MKNQLFTILIVATVMINSAILASAQAQSEFFYPKNDGHAKVQSLLNRHWLEAYPAFCPDEFEMITTIYSNKMSIIFRDQPLITTFYFPISKKLSEKYRYIKAIKTAAQEANRLGLRNTVSVWGITPQSALLLSVSGKNNYHNQVKAYGQS